MSKDSLCVAVTGATGFVGRHVVPALLDAGHTLRALVRDPKKVTVKRSGVQYVPGDLFDPASLRELVAGADAVVHLVGIIMEKRDAGQTFDRVHVQGTRNLLAAAKEAGSVTRWAHMSALGSRPDAEAGYHLTKWQAERAVRESGLTYTIFRPSIIHGPDGEFMQMVASWFRSAFNPPLPVPAGRFPFIQGGVPYFGRGLLGLGGAGRLQPVYVDDVADCFAKSLTSDAAANETYPMGGPDVFTWPQLYKAVQANLPGALDKVIIPVPAWYAKMIAGFPGVPFNWDQVVMSQEDSTCDTGKVEHDFGIELAAFEPTVKSYAAQID